MERRQCILFPLVATGIVPPVNSTPNARRPRRQQTLEEKQLWRALRAGHLAGFKFRRQHPLGGYTLDFYCPLARLSVELDGFAHGLPQQIAADVEREKFLLAQDIEELRFWNRQWRQNRDGVPGDLACRSAPDWLR